MKSNNDERLRDLSDDARQSRGAEIDRARTEPREVSDQQRVEAFRARHYQAVLPDLPDIPGFHVVWLSTTANEDTVRQREVFGYMPVKWSDVPGWGHPAASEGVIPETINVREMVAYKLPMYLYQEYMGISHHEKPLSEEEKLTTAIDAMKAQAKRGGTVLEEGDGMADIRDNRLIKPVFK